MVAIQIVGEGAVDFPGPPGLAVEDAEYVGEVLVEQIALRVEYFDGVGGHHSQIDQSASLEIVKGGVGFCAALEGNEAAKNANGVLGRCDETEGVIWGDRFVDLDGGMADFV
jgi:hypothetical protein